MPAEGQGARFSTPLEVLRQIHRDQGGYCTQCPERYPCATMGKVDALAEQLACAERNRRQSLADTARLRDDHDALAAENARLRAALTNFVYAAEELLEADIRDDFLPLIEARAALTRSADGGA